MSLCRTFLVLFTYGLLNVSGKCIEKTILSLLNWQSKSGLKSVDYVCVHLFLCLPSVPFTYRSIPPSMLSQLLWIYSNSISQVVWVLQLCSSSSSSPSFLLLLLLSYLSSNFRMILTILIHLPFHINIRTFCQYL